MGIDTTFMPLGPTTLVGVTPLLLVPKGTGAAGTSVRVRCLVTGYFSWGNTSSVAAPVTPVAGTPSINTIGMTAGGIETFELSAMSWFVSSNAAGFEMTPGQGA